MSCCFLGFKESPRAQPFKIQASSIIVIVRLQVDPAEVKHNEIVQNPQANQSSMRGYSIKSKTGLNFSDNQNHVANRHMRLR